MEEKNVFITGSCWNLGKQIAIEFAKNGYGILLNGRDKLKIRNAEKEISNYGKFLGTIVGDINHPKTLEEIAEKAEKENISILINNAAISCSPEPFSELSEDKINETLTTNLASVIKLTQKFYQIFEKKGGGIIVNISSLLGIEPRPYKSVYCASKWGLTGFTKALRIEAKKKNIQVIGIYPCRIKNLPEEYGLESSDVVKTIYMACENPSSEDIILDNRPTEFKKWARKKY